MKAMILAAGRGERMRPLTDFVPKPLLRVRNKPLIQYHVEALAASGITELVINYAHLGKQIVDYLGDGGQFGVKICYSPETEALGTGGGIANALSLLGNIPFIVVNADIWCDISFASLQLTSGNLAHLVLVDNPTHNPNGDFMLDGERVCNPKHRLPTLTFSGIGLYDPELFANCQPGNFPLPPILRAACERNLVSGHHHRGLWSDIGTPERLREIENLL
jgi:MurNAc alpha-1-phosphate uridylyltransferase